MYPILLEIPGVGFDLHTYGVLLALAFAAGISLAGALAKGEGLSAERFTDLGLVALVGGLAGGRLMYVLVEWDQFAGRPLDVLLRRDGFVFYGGLLGGAAAVAAAIRAWRLPLWRSADVLAPCVALGQAIGRLGCYAEGCCFGRPTDLPWGVTFPSGSYAHATQRAQGVVLPHDPYPAPVHPVQVYEALASFALFLLLMRLRGRRRWEGQVFTVYLGAYALLRGALEFLRGDDRGAGLLALSPGQATSLALLAVAAVLWKRLKPVPAV